MNDSFKRGDKVRFGRPNGEQTEGIIEKVNGKSLKVKTLEGRGSRAMAGQVWRVHPSLCTLVERNGKPVTAAERNAARFPNTPVRPGSYNSLSEEERVVAEALAKLTAVEIKALEAHFRRGYIDASRF